MKKNLAALFACFTAVSFLFTSCSSKGDDVDPPPKTRTELITTGTWRFGSATWGTTDAGPLLAACQKDNTMVFVLGSGTMDEGPTKCNAGDPQTVPFTWSFLSNETTLNISNPLFTGGSTTWTLVTLTEVELTVSQPLTVGGTTKTLIVTFIH